MRILLLLLLFMTTANAQSVSLLGLCNKTFDCDAARSIWSGSHTITTGWLEQSFGRACKCADQLLQSDKDKIIRVHLINSPCVRNKRCGAHEILAGESIESASRKINTKNRRLFIRFSAVTQRLKRRIANANRTLQCYVSACLECDLWPSARRVLRNYLSNHLSGCSIVDNPNHGRCIKGTICEKHGSAPKLNSPCIADLDGTDGNFVDLKAYQRKTRKCDMRFFWEPTLNCVDRTPFIDPKSRACRFNKADAKRIKRKLCKL